MSKNLQPMTRTIPALLARTHFGQVIDQVSQNSERFVVTKNGRAKAIILGIEDFLQVVKAPPQSITKLQEQAAKGGVARLTLGEVEEEIAQVRNGKPQQRLSPKAQKKTEGIKPINK